MESLQDFNGDSLGLLMSNNTNNDTIPMYIGFIACGISAIFYGTNFIPVKKFETGDGMFFQWVLCSAIMVVGLVIQMIRASKFHTIVMVGGMIWSTGNVCVVPVFKTIGMGLGICIWASFNLFIGWATGRFGCFGLIDSEVPNNQPMNYCGVAIALISSIIFSLVKSEVALEKLEMTVEVEAGDREPLLTSNNENIQSRVHGGSLYGSNSEDILVFNQKRRSSSLSRSLENSSKIQGTSDETFLDRLSPIRKKLVGVSLAMISGVFYGAQFIPAIHVQDKVEGSSKNSLDYVFAHFCGIFLASTFYFVIYIIMRRNQPRVYPKVILPGMISGVMWGVATSSWFIANKALSEPVSFPIISTLPAAIALVIGIAVFKEVKGRRNILVAVLGIAFTIAGALLAGLSKS